MRLLAVDLNSNFGAFNKPFSNSGGLLTYLIPPKTTIQGMLGSILGLTFPETVKVLSNFKYTVLPFSLFNTTNVTYNCHYGGRANRMVNIQQEVLIKPAYRIYIDIPDTRLSDKIGTRLDRNFSWLNSKDKSLFQILEKVMLRGQSYYTLYMGKNEFPLHYQLVEEHVKRVDHKDVINRKFPVEAAIPRSCVSDFHVDVGVKRSQEGFLSRLNVSVGGAFRVHEIRNLPKRQDEKRRFQEFENLILKEPGGNVQLEVRLNKDNLSSYSLYRTDRGSLLVCF